MGGQKVIKVFCHEEQSQRDFDKINDALCDASDKANAYGNILMPAVMNIGHFVRLVAIVAGLLVLFDAQTSPSPAGLPLGASSPPSSTCRASSR